MAAFSADSSALIAAVCAWHEHHEAAAGAIDSRLRAGEAFVLAGHALAETYAVLRAPGAAARRRCSPSTRGTSIRRRKA